MYEYQHRYARVCQICRAPRLPKLPRGLVLGHPLSPRESQIARMIAAGDPNKEIAGKLGLVEGTVKVYVSNIFAKTGMDNRTKLARWWWEKSDNPSKTA